MPDRHRRVFAESAITPSSCAELSTLALKTLIAAAVGTIVVFLLFWYVPFADPIEVVGPPLLRGYSEAAEQWAYYGFWITTIAVGIAISALRVDWHSPTAQRAGAMAVLLLPQIPKLAQLPLSVPALLVTWTAAYVCGGRASFIIERRFGPLRWPWVAVLVWCLGYQANLAILSEPQLAFRIITAAALLLGGLHFWKSVHSPRVASGLLALVVLGMLAAMRSLSQADLTVSLSAAIAYALGVVAGREPDSPHSRPIWLLFVLLTLLTAYLLSDSWGIEARVRCGLGGLGLGAVIHCLVRDWTAPARVTRIIQKHILANGTLWWITGTAGILAIWRPLWVTVIALSLGLFLVLHRGSPRRLRFWPAVGVGVFLVLAVVPLLRLLPLDRFHDGYNLTCAWEFESGRQLYTEILPIRSYQFFVTWLSRQVLPKTVDAYLLTFSVLQILPVIGAFALSLVWTRGSLPWSVATAVIVMAFSDLDSRQGMHLVLAASTLSALQRDRRATGWLIGFGSIMAGCGGFDVLCPFAAATTLTLFCIPDSARTTNPSTFYRRVFRLTQTAVLAVVPFSLFIAAWQGPRAAAEHWLVLRDFAAHFNAFSGLPIQWQVPSYRLLIGFGLTVLTAWLTVGAACWPTMSPARRRFWLFLMIQFGFLLHRGVGRSDAAHLNDLVIPSLVLLSLGSFECLRRLRRDGSTFARITSTNAASLILVLGAALVSEFPWQLIREPLAILEASRILQSRDTIPLGEVAYVQQTVAPDETLWTIENTTSNYANRRHLPTRHPLAHIICSPTEQRRAIADMRRRPPKLVEWPTHGVESPDGPRGSLNEGHFGTVCVIHSLDGIAAPLRYYLISQELLPRYRPTERPGYLEPAPTNWPGLVRLAPTLNEELDCQRLPLIWGEKRVPALAARTHDPIRLPEFHTTSSDASGEVIAGRTWEATAQLEPRRFNYLLLTFTAAGTSTSVDSSKAALQFTPDGWDDQTSSMTFTCATDERSHTYLLPVGCCPGWVWRSHITRLRIVAPEGLRLSAPRVEAWFVDELRQ